MFDKLFGHTGSVGRVLCVLAVAAALTGCVTPADRDINEHNRQIGNNIKKDTRLPDEVRQMGSDVELNAAQLQAGGAVPAPKTPTTYTPAESKLKRKESDEQHKNIDKIQIGLVGAIEKYVPGGIGIVGVGGWLFSMFRRRLESKKSFSLMQGVSDFSGKVPGLVAKIKGLNLKSADGLQDAVALIRGEAKDAQKVAQIAVGVHQEVRADIKVHQDAGKIKKIDTKTMAEKAADPTDPHKAV